MNTPKCYLSTSHGQWRVILQEMPLCADTTKENAIKCAQTFKVDLAAVYWDGEAGDFKELTK